MAEDSTVPLKLTLEYDHPLGALAPYYRGLDAGRAVATRCLRCGRVWFPPRLLCPDHGPAVEWTELSGRGRLIAVSISETTLPFSSTREKRAFALIALDGAENAAFGRVTGDPALVRAEQRVCLARAPGTWPHPAQAAWFVIES